MDGLITYRYFKNATKGKKIAKDIIDGVSLKTPFNHKELINLLQFHPRREIDIDKIEHLMVKIKPPYNGKSLYYKLLDSDMLENISYVDCLKNLYSRKPINLDKKLEQRKLLVFRMEVFNKHVRDEIYARDKVCQLCGNKEDLCLDHFEVSFKSIIEEFLNEEDITLKDIEIKYIDEETDYRLKDRNLRDRWCAFHNLKANYRVLCRKCNSSMGDYSKSACNLQSKPLPNSESDSESDSE